MKRLFLLALVLSAACHSAPPAPPPPPVVLSTGGAAALQWVQSHAMAISPSDSVIGADERARLFALVGNARLIGLSETTGGTREFVLLVRRWLFALADSGVRGLAIQAPMAETMEIDRYVRGTSPSTDLRRLIRPLGSWRVDTRDVVALIEEIRSWNRAHPDKQIGFYGFEIPTAAHAVRYITTLPDSVIGAPLKAWLVRQYACVATNEGAHFGFEGRASDSTFWSACGPAMRLATDSVVAWRARVKASHASDAAFAEEMARLTQHHVTVGLRHLSREEINAEHVLFLANLAGPDAKLLLWGGDIEMGRLADGKITQTGEALGKRLGDRYRAIAFSAGEGSIRTRPIPTRNPFGNGNPNAEIGVGNSPLARPRAETYEDVFLRSGQAAFYVDARTFPSDSAGMWLKGPREMRVVSEPYSPFLPPGQFETRMELPKYYDAVIFVRRVSPVRP